MTQLEYLEWCMVGRASTEELWPQLLGVQEPQEWKVWKGNDRSDSCNNWYHAVFQFFVSILQLKQQSRKCLSLKIYKYLLSVKNQIISYQQKNWLNISYQLKFWANISYQLTHPDPPVTESIIL